MGRIHGSPSPDATRALTLMETATVCVILGVLRRSPSRARSFIAPRNEVTRTNRGHAGRGPLARDLRGNAHLIYVNEPTVDAAATAARSRSSCGTRTQLPALDGDADDVYLSPKPASSEVYDRTTPAAYEDLLLADEDLTGPARGPQVQQRSGAAAAGVARGAAGAHAERQGGSGSGSGGVSAGAGRLTRRGLIGGDDDDDSSGSAARLG